MSETKKDNGFTRWSKKHAELWKFIKFSIAGGSSSAVELIVHMVLLNTAFKVLTSVPVVNDALNMIGITSKGYLYTILISFLQQSVMQLHLFSIEKLHLKLM